MERMDPSTKKQLSLLLAKTTGVKPAKPIVASVPLAQIRKTMLKDASSVSSPINSERSRSVSPLKSSKSNYEISKSPTKTKLSPCKSSYDFSSKSKQKEEASIASPEDTSDVPMDSIYILPGSPMKVEAKNSAISASGDVFMDAKSSSDEEIILNVPNSSVDSPARVEDLTTDLPQKIQLDGKKRSFTSSPIRNSFTFNPPTAPSPSSALSQQEEHFSASSPSIPSRVKSLGLVSGTPLRAIYRNFSLTSSNNFDASSKAANGTSSLLNDLIEEYHNTLDSNCLKKILSLTSVRSGEYDQLTSDLVHKLFVKPSIDGALGDSYHLKIILNFLRNEPFLLSLSCRKIIDLLENINYSDSCNVEILEISKIICKTNLLPILMESCIESCYEKLSEFKLILLAECTRNFIGKSELSQLLTRSITPLLLVLYLYFLILYL
jgi:hypothetical protein